MQSKEDVKAYIRRSYGQIAAKGGEGGCCSAGSDCGGPVAVPARLGYAEAELAEVPSGANMGLGCGNPAALAAPKEGETVLDLGCGGGLDCFVARKYVGESGRVIGVDMTAEMIDRARKNAATSGYANVEFRLGEIEHLPVADNAVDVVISNCVLNLSPDKEQVFREIFRVLKPGGRLAVSDIVATASLPEGVAGDLRQIAGCVGGAAHVDAIKSMLENAGFVGIKLAPKDNSSEILRSWAPGRNIEEYLASYVIEARKPD